MQCCAVVGVWAVVQGMIYSEQFELYFMDLNLAQNLTFSFTLNLN